MSPTHAADVLRRLVLEAGVDPARPVAADVARTWAVYQQFAGMPVDDTAGPDEDGDGLLVQYGVYDWGDEDGEHFSFDFTRQFIRLDEDGDQEISQLRCAFVYEVTPALQAVPQEVLWSFEFDLAEYFARVAALDGFQQVMALQQPPRRLRIVFEGDVC